MDIRIRDFEAQDFDQVAQLIALLQAHVASLDPHGLNKTGEEYDAKAYVEQMIRKAKEENGFVLVAENESVITGCIATTDQPENETDHHPSKQASIDELIVSDDVRGKGIGSLLMQEAEKRYKERGYQFLRVICFTPNADAYRFYKKCGFDDRYTNLIKKL